MKRAALALAVAILPLTAALNQPIKIKDGLVTGAPGKDPSITTFKGVPFAAPPVGDLRWRAPKSTPSWRGVRTANKFSASCIQQIAIEHLPWTYEFLAHNEISEDCLYLNVFTAAESASEKRPVFVYIYGGGFNEGSAAVPLYDGEGLAKKGLVVVTFNYRVGVLGFLAHPDLTRESGHSASGNYGLMDQIAALRWVHQNIARFGGDPNRVTIAGQSAGSISVHDLTASPLAKELFHRAIAQSGGSTVGGVGINIGPTTLATAEAEGQRFAELKGANTLAELRAMSWKKLLEPLRIEGTGKPAPRFAPIVDGYVLPAPFMEIIAQGMQTDVPTLTGANTGELGGIMGPQGTPITAATFQAKARERYGAAADQFLKLYPAETDEQAAVAQRESTRDQALVAMYLWAKVRARTAKTPVYEYLWDHTLPGQDSERLGAFHSSEVPYVLNTLYASERPFADADRKIAEMMSSYWANFAANGDPNGKDLPVWPTVGDKPEIMEVGDKTQPIPLASSPERVQFFQTLLERPK